MSNIFKRRQRIVPGGAKIFLEEVSPPLLPPGYGPVCASQSFLANSVPGSEGRWTTKHVIENAMVEMILSQVMIAFQTIGFRFFVNLKNKSEEKDGSGRIASHDWTKAMGTLDLKAAKAKNIGKIKTVTKPPCLKCFIYV